MELVHRRRLTIAINNGGIILLVLIGLDIYRMFRRPASAGQPSGSTSEASA